MTAGPAFTKHQGALACFFRPAVILLTFFLVKSGLDLGALERAYEKVYKVAKHFHQEFAVQTEDSWRVLPGRR